MYRIAKVLNHNAVIAIGKEDNAEYLLMGKGVGFGKKVSQQVDQGPEDTVYSLTVMTEHGNAREMIKSISPESLELANEILLRAEKAFGRVDKNILFPMVNHIEYAVKRIQNHEQISNPLTDDIRVLFHGEYKVAECIKPLLRKKMQIEIDEHEIGYIALHVHTAIEDQKISQAMQTAQAVRECITLVEQKTGKQVNVMSLTYNRLMNHVRYMVTRVMNGESLKINLNDYMKVKFPEAFRTAATVCEELGKSLKCNFEEMEIGYLAIHIERVTMDEIQE